MILIILSNFRALTGVPNVVNDLQERVSVLNQRQRERSDASQKLLNSRDQEQEASNLEQELKQKLKIQKPDVKDEDFNFQKQFLKKDKFISVEVMSVITNCEYYIQRSEDADKFINLMNDLKTSNLAPIAELIVGSLVACKFYDIWHRAMILSVDPLTVHLIDYGVDQILKDNDIRDLGRLKNIPRFSRQIFIQNRTEDEPLKENEQLLVKLISENENGILMVVIPQVEKASSVKSGRSSQNRRDSQSSHKSANNKIESSPKKQDKVEESRSHSHVKSPAGSSKGEKRQAFVAASEEPSCPTGSIIDHLEAKDEGAIEIHTQLGKNTFSITIIPHKLSKYYEKVLVDLPISCKAMARTQNYT